MLHRLALRLFGLLPGKARSRVIRVLYPTFTAGSVVCLTDPSGRVLLARHSYSSGWGLPGGLIGRNEDPAATATREMREELGLELVLDGPPLPYKPPGRRHFNFIYRLSFDPASADPLTSQSPEILAVDWFPLDTLPELAEYTGEFLAALGMLPHPTQPSGD